MLQRFKMLECKPQNTPIITRQVAQRGKRIKSELKITKGESKNNPNNNIPYREAIGSLLYLAGATRPDITYAVSYLARKQLEPTEDDWIDVKRIFRYLRGTMHLGLRYLSRGQGLEAMSDASFRDCSNSATTGGYIVRLFGDTIAWRSNKQRYVTLSTCQAEYVAMSEACQEVILIDKATRYILGYTFYPATI